MTPANFTAKILKKVLIAEDTFQLTAEIAGIQEFDFIPGQFVTILVNPSARRSYSIASMPQTNMIELIGDTVAGGPGSQFFADVKEQDTVSLLGPLGRFVYKEDPAEAIFCATGTGLVPFMSMIPYALKTLKTSRQIKLFTSFRYQKSIFGQQLFTDLANEYPNFKFFLTLTRPEQNWQGLSGRIYEHYMPQISSSSSHAYICGSHHIVDETKQNLLAKGLVSSNIFFEQYY